MTLNLSMLNSFVVQKGIQLNSFVGCSAVFILQVDRKQYNVRAVFILPERKPFNVGFTLRNTGRQWKTLLREGLVACIVFRLYHTCWLILTLVVSGIGLFPHERNFSQKLAGVNITQCNELLVVYLLYIA